MKGMSDSLMGRDLSFVIPGGAGKLHGVPIKFRALVRRGVMKMRKPSGERESKCPIIKVPYKKSWIPGLR